MAASEGWGDDGTPPALSGGEVETAASWRRASRVSAKPGPNSARTGRRPGCTTALQAGVGPGRSYGGDFVAGAALAMAATLRPRGAGRVASLQGLCLGCIGEHLEEFLQCGEQAVAWLSSEQRAALAAIARRRGILDGQTLELLVDSHWVVLDIAGCRSIDTDTFLLVLSRLPHLQALDLTRCDQLPASSLRQLPFLCPKISHLRLGGSELCSKVAAKALKHILPRVNAVEEDSWEDVEDGDIGGGLCNLSTIIWPDISPWHETYIMDQCPKVRVHFHDPPKPGAQQQCPPWPALDLPIADVVGPAAWRVLHASLDARLREREPLPIARRFKLAIDEIDARHSSKHGRNIRQKQRREGKRSAVAAAMELWLDDGGGIAL